MALNKGAWKILSQGAWQPSVPAQVYYSISPFGTGDIKTNPTITKAQSTGTHVAAATSIVLAYTGNVTVGNVLVVAVSKYTPSTDVFVVGDISKSAGTATIGSWQLDKAEEHFTSGSEYCSAALYSAVVTGTGSCTITVDSVAGSYLQLGIMEFSGISTATDRCESTNSGEADTGTDIHAGSMTSARGAVFVATSYFNTSTNTTITEDSGVLVYEDEVGADGPASVTEQIVTTGTTLNPGWTISANRIWVAVGGAYKTAPNISITSGVATLDVAQTGNIGQGCQIVYGGHTCYISKVNSSTSFDVVTAVGGLVTDHTSIAVTSISHVWASLSAAEAAWGGASYVNNWSLIEADVVLNICCYYDHDDYTADTTAVVINGTTSDVNRYLNIYTPNGGTQSINGQRSTTGIYDTNKYRLTSSTGIMHISGSVDNYIRVVGLQFGLSPDGFQRYCITLDGSGTPSKIYIDKCIFKALADNSHALLLDVSITGSGATVYITNNVLTDGAIGLQTTYMGSAAAVYVYNCTFYGMLYGNGDGVITTSSRPTWITNSVFFNNTDDYSSYGTFPTIDYCASDDNDQGTNKIDLDENASSQWTNGFIDYANYNFALKPGGLMTNAGLDLSSVDSIAAEYLATDITGITRPTDGSWDVGAFEFSGYVGLGQEGFRFRNDDGNETGASWIATQDTNVNMPSNNTLRLRLIVDTYSTCNNESFQLEYRYQTPSNNFSPWIKAS